MMPECNMASSVILIVLVHWRHWFSSHLSTNCRWSPPSHRYAMTCDAILTRSPVEWNWTPMSQIKAQSGPWERGIHWSWVFPTHWVSSEWTSLSPHFVSEIFSILLSMASFVFRSIQYYWNAKDNDHELHGLFVFDWFYFWGHSLWVKPCEPPSRCLQGTSSIHHFSMALSMRCVPPCLIKTRHSWRSLLVLAKWRWSQKRPAVAKRDTYRHID